MVPPSRYNALAGALATLEMMGCLRSSANEPIQSHQIGGMAIDGVPRDKHATLWTDPISTVGPIARERSKI
jgi:hypothetical protein